jgi:hypothetical protein
VRDGRERRESDKGRQKEHISGVFRLLSRLAFSVD